jgi:hypothetical protein
MEKEIIKFYCASRSVEDLLEFISEILPFTNSKIILKRFIYGGVGDNDIDNEIGRIGYNFLTSDAGLKALSAEYSIQFEKNKKKYKGFLTTTVAKLKELLTICQAL